MKWKKLSAYCQVPTLDFDQFAISGKKWRNKNRQKLHEFRSFFTKHQVSSQQSPGIDGTSVPASQSGSEVVSDEGSDLHPCMVYVYYGMIFIYRRPICLSTFTN